MMKKLSLTLVTALLATSALAAAPTATAAKPYASVNGKQISPARADAIIAAQKAQGQAESDQMRQAVREELIRREILAQEATRLKMDKVPEVRLQVEMAQQNVLIGAYLQSYVKTHPVTDEAIKKEYEIIRAAMGDKEYKARHILVEKEDEAKALIGKLAKGEKFEELAKQSKDPGSKDKGGDLGWAAPASYVKDFSAAMTALSKGKHTDKPVKSDFGWHVILLEDVRDIKAPALDEVKQQLTQRIQQRIVDGHINELRSKAKVE
ncbi:MAG: peptidylprolyl isomerase [Rhodocyclaceae bacterium]|nr:peptidylprolyl isomerase [Rhodocyclaceae bacterium]